MNDNSNDVSLPEIELLLNEIIEDFKYDATDESNDELCMGHEDECNEYWYEGSFG